MTNETGPEDATSLFDKDVDKGKSNIKLNKLLIFILVILGFITTFVSGLFVGNLLSNENNVTTQKPLPTGMQGTSDPNVTGTVQETTKFLPGKHYFDDTVMMVTTDEPRRNLVVTVARVEQDGNYIQNTRVSYFNGEKWGRQLNSILTNDSAIVSDKLIKSWTTDFDPSRVLKETAKGDITFGSDSLSFSTSTLKNEIGIRSLPGYTKFLSNGTGTLTINGEKHTAYVLYTRIYSLNASDIQFYNQTFQVTTDYIVFWDKDGNFYHADVTNVDKPTPIYQTHQLGVEEKSNGAVNKTFDVAVRRDDEVPPVTYEVSLKDPVNAVLKFSRINALNKSPNGGFTWFMGNIEGSVTTSEGITTSGVGLVEYIKD